MQIGGWGGWNYAIGSKMFLKNALGEDILTYCLLDSDYHTPEAISTRLDEAKKVGVRLHIWRKKEIENYLIAPRAIARLIASKLTRGTEGPTENRVRSRLGKIAETQKDLVFDAIAQEVLGENKSKGAKFANEIARERIEVAWKSSEGKLSVVSGKLLLSKLSEWSQDRFGVSLGARAIARELRIHEIDAEMSNVIASIEQGTELP
jgi:hypothetical protein